MGKTKIKIINNEEIDLRALFKVLKNARLTISFIVLLFVTIGIIYSLQITPLYKSSITLYPNTTDNDNNLGQFAGMASQLGLNLGGGKSSYNISDIINSRRIKYLILNNKWEIIGFDEKINLIDYWKILNDKSFINQVLLKFKNFMFGNNSNYDIDQAELHSSLEILNDRLYINESETGLISVSVHMEQPRLAKNVVNSIYNYVVDFTNESHNESVKSNKKFIEDRKKIVKEELKVIEDQLTKFRSENRASTSPKLTMEIERMLREIEIKTNVFITLEQQYELSKIEEVKQIASIVILDAGIIPAFKDTPRRKIIVLSFLFLGLLNSVFFALFRHTLNN